MYKFNKSARYLFLFIENLYEYMLKIFVLYHIMIV